MQDTGNSPWYESPSPDPLAGKRLQDKTNKAGLCWAARNSKPADSLLRGEGTSPQGAPPAQALGSHSLAIHPYVPSENPGRTALGFQTESLQFVTNTRACTSAPGWTALWRRPSEVTLPSALHSTALDLLLQKNASKFTLHIPPHLEVSKLIWELSDCLSFPLQLPSSSLLSHHTFTRRFLSIPETRV